MILPACRAEDGFEFAFGGGRSVRIAGMSSFKRFLLVWFGVIALILIGAMFIVTDTKRVHRVLQGCESAVRDSDAGALMNHIARDYQYQSLDWQTMHDLAKTIFQQTQFSTTFLRNKKIKVEGDTADVTFNAIVQSAEGSALPGPFSTRWRLKLQKRDKQWLITEIEFLSLNGNPVGPLGAMMAEAAAMSR